MLNNFNMHAFILFPVWKLQATETPTIISNHTAYEGRLLIVVVPKLFTQEKGEGERNDLDPNPFH
jgi:hypothetical protein